MLSVSASFHRSPATWLRSLLSSNIQSQRPLPEISCQMNVRRQRNGAVSLANNDGDIIKASLAVDTQVRPEKNHKITLLISIITQLPRPRLSSPRGGTRSITPETIYSINRLGAPATCCYLPHMEPRTPRTTHLQKE